MGEVMQQVIEFFRAKEWSCEVDEENQLVRSGISSDNGEWKVVVVPSTKDQVCLVLSVFPVKCPEPRRGACSELLTRINYGMLVGGFELDFENGRINFKTSYPFPGNQVDAELLDRIVGFNLHCMDRYLPAIMSVVYAGTPPSRAMAQLERQDNKKKKSSGKGLGRARRFLNN